MSDTLPPPQSPVPAGSAGPSGRFNFAPVPKRLGAMLLEVLPFAVIVGVGVWAANPGPARYDDESTESLRQFLRVAAAGVAIMVILLVWFVWSRKLWAKSTTLGKKPAGMHVVNVKTGAPATMTRMLVREVVGKWGILIIGAMVLGGTAGNLAGNEDDFNRIYLQVAGVFIVAYSLVNAILVVATPNRQGVWDYLARTTVVQADRTVRNEAP